LTRSSSWLILAVRFTCATCGAGQDIDEISSGADAPVQWALLSYGQGAAPKRERSGQDESAGFQKLGAGAAGLRLSVIPESTAWRA
jgi:hypothetical protein